jgi:hypothetical protein
MQGLNPHMQDQQPNFNSGVLNSNDISTEKMYICLELFMITHYSKTYVKKCILKLYNIIFK